MPILVRPHLLLLQVLSPISDLILGQSIQPGILSIDVSPTLISLGIYK